MSSKNPDPIAAHGPPSEPSAAQVAIVRLLARQAARDLVSETVPGSSPEHAANDKEYRHGAHDKQDR